jgi:hypothetical protein
MTDYPDSVIEGRWQPIETAPKDGRLVLCYWSDRDGVEPCFLRWKTNQRFVRDRERVRDNPERFPEEDRKWLAERLDSYFGDPEESDDYDLAMPQNAPTHWLPLPKLP